MLVDNRIEAEAVRLRHAIGVGSLCWVVLCVVFVACRGVRWDETYEHAQLLAGWVDYPPWHPLPRYLNGAFSIQTVLSAWLLRLGGSATLLCGVRNVLFLLATVLPVFLFTTSLTGRTRWGHLAVLLMLQGIFLEFDGSYPTFVWPEFYSNGHIGGGFALVTVWAAVFGYHRMAGFMFGLLPAIHLGQFPPVLLLVANMGCAALLLPRQAGAAPRQEPTSSTLLSRKRAWLTPAGYMVGALLITLAAYYLGHGEATPDTGNSAAAQELWRDYTFHHDPHRRFPPVNGHIILAGTLLLAALRGTGKKDHGGLLLYVGIVAAVVWGTMTLHIALGDRLPFLFIAWMPYRLINHIPPLCMALAVATLAGDKRGAWLVPAGLVACVLVFQLGPLSQSTLYTRYLAHGEWLAFLLFGAALASVSSRRFQPKTLVAALALAPFHQFGALCLLCGAAVRNYGHRWCCPGFHRVDRLAIMGTVIGLATFLLVVQQARQHDPLPATPFNRAIATNTEAGALLLGPPDALMLQATTDRPVLVEAATASFISYVPQLAPAIDALHRDLYGITFSVPKPEGFDVPWVDVWEERDLEAWATLSTQYGFRYVVAPKGPTLQLTLVHEGGDEGRLYRIP